MSRPHGSGPRPSDRNATMCNQLTTEIDRTIRAYHDHSKTCRPCRQPRTEYEARRNLCPTGTQLQVELMERLYLKAEYVPEGTFRVEYRQGWVEIDELIRVICHYKQGEYTHKVIDLKRAKPRSQAEVPRIEAPPVPASRGSGWEEDMRRRNRAAAAGPPSPALEPMHFSSTNLAVYHNPSPAGSHVSSGDRKSVHFDQRIRVREFVNIP